MYSNHIFPITDLPIGLELNFFSLVSQGNCFHLGAKALETLRGFVEERILSLVYCRTFNNYFWMWGLFSPFPVLQATFRRRWRPGLFRSMYLLNAPLKTSSSFQRLFYEWDDKKADLNLGFFTVIYTEILSKRPI